MNAALVKRRSVSSRRSGNANFKSKWRNSASERWKWKTSDVANKRKRNERRKLKGRNRIANDAPSQTAGEKTTHLKRYRHHPDASMITTIGEHLSPRLLMIKINDRHSTNLFAELSTMTGVVAMTEVVETTGVVVVTGIVVDAAVSTGTVGTTTGTPTLIVVVVRRIAALGVRVMRTTEIHDENQHRLGVITMRLLRAISIALGAVNQF